MTMLHAALQLARRGFAIFPVKPRAKEPAAAGGCTAASRNPSMLSHWWGLDQNYNIGAATGTPSGVFVVDVDGVDAEAELRKLELAHGALPATVEVVTPRPGRHLYFRMPDMPVRNSAGRVAPGIDVRATGGYVLTPPSIHPGGRRYVWSVDSASAFATAPRWLLDRIAGANGDGHVAPTPPSQWRDLMANGVPEGRRADTLARVTGYLLRHHVDPVFAAGLVGLFNDARCLPPLPQRDVQRIVDSIAGKELKRRGGNGHG